MPKPNGLASKDRHLKRIYDCLNIGCHKKAVQEVDRLPKQVRDLTVFKALKSLALIRMYKRRQAFEILNEINPEDDLDEVTLQTMTSCYKESVDVSRIVDLYEAASRRKPNDPEILAHLFMAHVRIFNFKRQKEIAMQMYKNFPQKKRLYSFWAIMSLIMQSQETNLSCSQGASDKRVCLSLAEKMCEKMIDDERTNEEIELYLMILRKQNKHEEEYKFLTGPICLRITDHLSWFNRRRAYLCLDLKMYSRAFKHYFPSLIQEYPDQIEYYQGLFKSAFLLDTKAPSQQQPVALNDQQSQGSSAQSAGTPVKSTSALAECFDIVEKQCMLSSECADSKDQKGKNQNLSNKNLSRTSSLNPTRRRFLRGPFMARIELFHIILTNESTLPSAVFNLCKSQFTNKYPTLNSLLLDYFQAFSRKISCYYDMDHMMKQFKISNQDKESLIASIKEWAANVKQTQPEISAFELFHIQLNCHILEHSIRSYNANDAREDRLKLCKNYIDLYDQSRHLGLSANKTEFQPVDNYCLLAVNSIMTNSLELDRFLNSTILTDSLIISLIVLTETAVANSPSNHQLKLTLLKLYSFIGASKQSSEVLLLLDIKHFQIDTLGHLLNPVLYNTGNYSLSRESLETCLEFYALGVRECLDGLTSSYRDGRFSKIEEISKVLKRLCDSLNAAQCVLLKGIVANLGASTLDELIAASKSFDPFKGLHRMFRCPDCVDIIRDSRDFKVLKSLNAETNDLVQKRQLETLEDEQLWLKLRYYILRSVYIQLEFLSEPNSSAAEKKERLEELDLGLDLVEKLRPQIEEAAKKNRDDNSYSYFEPEASPFRWKHINFMSLVSMVTPLVFLSDTSFIDETISDNYNSHLDTIVNDLEAQLSSISSLVHMKQALLSLTISVEFISLCVTSLVSMVHSASASQTASHTNSSSGGKNSSTSQQQQQVPAKPKQMINKTEAQLTKLSNLIKSIDAKTLIVDQVTTLESCLLSREGLTGVETKCGAILMPLMGQEATQTTFSKVKECLVNSFNESLKEIEGTCRRKIKLLRSRDG